MKLEQEKTFKCNQCGSCCSHIRGMMPQEDKEFMKEMAYGKLPLVQLVPIEKMSFPLWDWEAKRFRKWQQEVNVDAKIKPSRAILDLSTNKTIIVTYFMDSDACPFLKDRKCLVYTTKRAYVCRLFPFNRGPFLKTGEEPKKENMFGTCDAMEKLMPIIPENYNDMVKFLSKAFPDGSFENAVQFDYITEWVNRTIVVLMKKKLLRPAMNYPYDFFLKRFENSEKIDFTDFLEQSGYIDNKEELIKKFDENRDAKVKINEFLQQS
ncbi:MAG: YkgJ family cysteine cluster protein [Flavobacteriales bacterium]|jgi:Fe-S-cluster containining protein|nr:YkgJ family cysteine cluster protein [Flavobacteriales bacterium]|tara:strand:- start:1680 stop:2474 length:795 start_codon:yes stop_codon:yes gene_type:complete